MPEFAITVKDGVGKHYVVEAERIDPGKEGRMYLRDASGNLVAFVNQAEIVSIVKLDAIKAVVNVSHELID